MFCLACFRWNRKNSAEKEIWRGNC